MALECAAVSYYQYSKSYMKTDTVLRTAQMTLCNRELHHQDQGTQRCTTRYGGLPLSKSLTSTSLCIWGLIIEKKICKNSFDMHRTVHRDIFL